MEEVFYRPPVFTTKGGNISGGKQANLFDLFLSAILPDPCGEKKVSLQEDICRSPAIFRFQDDDRLSFVAQMERHLVCGSDVLAETLLQAEGIGCTTPKKIGGENLLSQVLSAPAEVSLFQPEANLAPVQPDFYVVELSSPQKLPPVELKMDSFSPDLSGGAAKQLSLPDGNTAAPLLPELADAGAMTVVRSEAAAANSSQAAADMGEPGLIFPAKDGLLALRETGPALFGSDPQTANSRQSEDLYLYSLRSAEPACGALRAESSATSEPGIDQGDGQKRAFQPADIYPGEQLPPKRAYVADAAQPLPILTSQVQRSPEPLPAGFEPGKDGALKEQLLRQIQGRLLYIRENGGAPAEMRLRLNPPEMGEITIRVFSRQGQLSALIQVEAPLAMEILEGSLPELRQRFQQSSLSLEQLDLSLAGHDDQNRGGFGAERFLTEERRWEQNEQPYFIREGPSETTFDGYNSGGIEYWA